MSESLYPGIEIFLKANSSAALKVSYASTSGFLASLIDKKTYKSIGRNGHFCETVNDAITSLDRRLREVA